MRIGNTSLKQNFIIASSRIFISVLMSSQAIPPLLISHDATGHIHLIIGSNPLANARCSKSLEVGAKPIIVAPAGAEIHYALLKKIETNGVQWIQRQFENGDLTSLGRNDVEGVVDAVFVTLGGKNPLSM